MVARNSFIDNDHHRRGVMKIYNHISPSVEEPEKRALSYRHIQYNDTTRTLSGIVCRTFRRRATDVGKGPGRGRTRRETGELEGADGSKE